MKSASYFRDLTDDELVLAGREMDARPPAYVEVLLDRFAELVDENAKFVIESDLSQDEINRLRDRVAELEEKD